MKLIVVFLLLVFLTPVAQAAAESALDTDGDRISDHDEMTLWHTSPMDLDSDGDGYSDGLEIKNGYDPLVPDGAKLKKKIVVDIKGQNLSYSMGPLTLGTYRVSTGVGKTTPRGTFAVEKKIPKAWSTTSKLWMPYFMGFIGTKYGIHELPIWPNGAREGERALGKPASHGCIRLGVGAAKTLYDWADVGTEVVIQ